MADKLDEHVKPLDIMVLGMDNTDQATWVDNYVAIRRSGGSGPRIEQIDMLETSVSYLKETEKYSWYEMCWSLEISFLRVARQLLTINEVKSIPVDYHLWDALFLDFEV